MPYIESVSKGGNKVMLSEVNPQMVQSLLALAGSIVMVTFLSLNLMARRVWV